jgi:hypothetical protein
MFDSKNWCGMPNMMGVVDGTHISITKQSCAYFEKKFFHKTGGYNVVAQLVVDSQKRFMDVYVGLLQNVNDSYVLTKSKLYQHAIHRVSLTWLLGHKMESHLIFLEIKGIHYFHGLWHRTKKVGKFI